MRLTTFTDFGLRAFMRLGDAGRLFTTDEHTLEHWRFDIARTLLADPDISVTNVAERLGRLVCDALPIPARRAIFDGDRPMIELSSQRRAAG